MKKFMYYTTRENNNLIAVNPFIKPKDYEAERKDGWLFSVIDHTEFGDSFNEIRLFFVRVDKSSWER